MIDGHAHLNEIEDIESAILRARAAGVDHIIAVGMDVVSNRTTLKLREQFPDIIYPAIGYHPWSIKGDEIEENLLFLQENLAQCIALGEVGLDYQAKIKKHLQVEVFARVLKLAVSHQKPVIVHTRFSQQRAYQMLHEAGIAKAVFHWYGGPLDLLEHIIESGYFVSATPALSYSPPHRAAIAQAPLQQILIETDAPVVYQGKISEPADLQITLRELAGIKELEVEKVERITTANARKFFGI